MKNLLRGIGIGFLAALIVLIDSVFCSFVFPGKLFVWVAFASWTVFFTATTQERLKSLTGYIIGIVCSLLIMILGNLIFEYLPLSINNLSQTSFIGTFIVVSILMIAYECELLKFTSISSIFIGIWLIFSGLGAGMYPSDVKSTITIVLIIMGYSILGLVAGYFSMLLYKKIPKTDNKDIVKKQ